MTSSTTVTRRPATSAPSASRAVPYALACLRTKVVGSPVRNDSAVAIGTPPSSRPASTSVPSGTRATRAAAISSSNSGSASKRYLSKYSLATWPLRSVNVPVKRAMALIRWTRSSAAGMGGSLAAGGGPRHPTGLRCSGCSGIVLDGVGRDPLRQLERRAQQRTKQLVAGVDGIDAFDAPSDERGADDAHACVGDRV